MRLCLSGGSENGKPKLVREVVLARTGKELVLPTVPSATRGSLSRHDIHPPRGHRVNPSHGVYLEPLIIMTRTTLTVTTLAPS